jgi:two-component system CheB/CheR fusion protein
VIFGRHDLVQDPPISRIDLLVSRNTLMYFTPSVQTQILSNFHFALREGRYLFLGKSEVLVSRLNLFMPVDLKRRVFVKVANGAVHSRTARQRRARPTALPPEVADELRDAVFEAAGDPTLVVDRAGTLVLANTHARTLFGLQPKDVGRPLQDLELSYRPVELRSRIEEAYTDGHAVSIRDVEWRLRSGEVRVVDATVTPIRGTASALLGCVITFSDVSRYRLLQRALQESKRDVEVAYEELQSAVEELETTNEEIQSANEELETTNEELQSANEELETMNEELHSTNEELQSINDELRDRTDEVNETNAFLESILTSIDAGVVVVDRELRIVAWNKGAFELWGLRGEEAVGQHFLNLDIGLPVEQLRGPFRESFNGEQLERVSVPAVNRLGRAVECVLNIVPWRNAAREITGLIVMMEAAEQEQA